MMPHGQRRLTSWPNQSDTPVTADMSEFLSTWPPSRQLRLVMGRELGVLRFAPDPLGDPHPELRLVTHGLRGRDVPCRGDLFGGQAK
jgi:hypothetical protein